MDKENGLDFEQFGRLLKEDRSVRRFKADLKIDRATLEKLVGLTRFCASGRNVQSLRYLIINEEADREKIFPLLKWAGYYQDWDGPEPDERPAAYLVQCLDTTYGPNPLCDDGLQLQTLTLGARALGIGGCIIKSFNAPKLSEEFNLPEKLEPRYVLALGYPAEYPRIVDMPSDGDFKYYRGENNEQCVPKRPLSELLIN